LYTWLESGVLKMFKVGDKVESRAFGKGVVTFIYKQKHSPVVVEFRDSFIGCFTSEGNYFIKEVSEEKIQYHKLFLCEEPKEEVNQDTTSFVIGTKYDTDKLDWTLLPFDSLEEVVEVLMMGEKKYARDNWMFVKPKSRYLKAAFRHLIQYASGELVDAESGKSHLAHCVSCLLFLIWHDKKGSD
jgi:hypothetical protein